MAFRVTTVFDGDTFAVIPNWQWNGAEGNRVRPTGYDAPELHKPGGQSAKLKLERIVLGKDVELRNPKTIDRGRLVTTVFINGRNLADYFTEYAE